MRVPRLPIDPGRWLMPVIALALGVAIVVAYDLAVTGSRYPYSGDSASYLEMASSLAQEHRPLVVPWELVPVERDRVLQPLFPPGFSLLIAGLAPLAGSVKAAALWPGRVAAALLPLLVLLAFRGQAPDAALIGVGLATLMSEGTLYWHFIAYSDVPCLALTIAALGLLTRGLTGRPIWLIGAGVAAALCYALRNAGIAVLLASVAAILLEARPAPVLRRAFAFWLAGALPVVAAIKAYDFAMFGSLEPYHMAPSTRPFFDNLRDWVQSLLADLHLRAADAGPIGPAAALAILAAAVAALAFGYYRLRSSHASRTVFVALALYIGAGGSVLVLARSRYEWGDTIDTRHALQYSWSILLLAVVIVRATLGARGRWIGGGLAAAALAALLLHTVDVVETEQDEPEYWQRIASDRALLDQIRALPRGLYLASNESALLRIETGRAFRQLDVGGDDASLDGGLSEMRRVVAGQRPAAFVLVCNDWTRTLSDCATPPARSDSNCRPLRRALPVVALCADSG
jgi:hypothetical protein